jgi:hypothetical protein
MIARPTGDEKAPVVMINELGAAASHVRVRQTDAWWADRELRE